ncbi:MAG: MBL fold metallo-hydrolase, partial [Gammaproteobacteria bacterium]
DASVSVPDREIVWVVGDLYRMRVGRHYGVFLVTSEGIILVDPTNPEQAAWLKAEFKERFDLPVKYVIYSHAHNDHAGGGDVFADTATFIAHENMQKNLVRPADNAPLLPREALWDINGSGRIEKPETSGSLVNTFDLYDSDGDGSLTRAEIWAVRMGGETVRPPDIVYSDRSVIALGGKRVELHYTGLNHTDDMTVVYFPEEKAIYTVDFLTPNRPPRTDLDGGYLPEWLDSLRRVEQIDFDIILPGHESVGTKADVSEQVRYMEDLLSAVKEGIATGKTKDELINSILLEDYDHLIEYDFSRAGNVAGAYEILISSKIQ